MNRDDRKRRPSGLIRHKVGDRDIETTLKLIERSRIRDRGKAKSRPIISQDFVASNITKDTLYTPWLKNTVRHGISFDYNTASPLEGLAEGAISAIMQGVRFASPLDDSYYTDPPGRDTVPLSGTLLYVDSIDQTFFMDAVSIFGTSTEKGYISFLFQGLDLGDDGTRLYYVMDSSYMKIWYDESDSTLNFNPDAINNNKILSITLSGGDDDWFGNGKHEIFVSWDYDQQVFELWWDETRATYSVNAGDASKPNFESADFLTFVNSDPTTGDADAGQENMYGMIDEIQLVGDFPPLRVVTSLDGIVSSTLYPIHPHGIYDGACGETSATEISLGTAGHPFDSIVVKTATVICDLFVGRDAYIDGDVFIDGDISADGNITTAGIVSATGDISTDSEFSGVSINLSNPPRCRAYLSSDQLNLTDNTWTIIQLNAETYDSGSIFNTGTYRCTPDREGYYQVIVQGQFKATLADGKYIFAGIFKNGSLASQDLRVTGSASKGHAVGVSDMIYMNGSTDYLEFKMKHWNGTNTPDVLGGTQYTYLCCHKMS